VISQAHKPGEGPYTTRTPRVSAALKLQRRKERDATGRFLAEGPQAVREALASGAVRELFITDPAAHDRRDFAEIVRSTLGEAAISEKTRRSSPTSAGGGLPAVSVVTEEAMKALAETVTPQGIVAVCEQVDIDLAQAVARQPQLVAVAVDIRDPGNAGTILRTADAAGAGVVIFAGEAVDPYNGKCVRASAGSLFHVDIVRERDIDRVLDALAGMQVFATTGRGAVDLFELEPRLAQPTAWLFGGEAHGLPEEVMQRAERVRVPIYGGAESLNLAAAAAICLYASARAQRSSPEL
jgi:TrmH family RNA methyltransferase